MTKPRPRTLLLTSTLIVTAVAVRGPVGGLLGIAALLVILDAVIPMPGTTWSEADDRFTQLLRDRRRARLWRRLRGLAPRQLELMDDRGALAARRSLGVRPIAIDSITATVEEGKAHAFDDEFRPARRAAARWKGSGWRRRAGRPYRRSPSTASARGMPCATATTACRWRVRAG